MTVISKGVLLVTRHGCNVVLLATGHDSNGILLVVWHDSDSYGVLLVTRHESNGVILVTRHESNCVPLVTRHDNNGVLLVTLLDRIGILLVTRHDINSAPVGFAVIRVFLLVTRYAKSTYLIEASLSPCDVLPQYLPTTKAVPTSRTSTATPVTP